MKKSKNLEKIVIDLPMNTFPILAHLENIKYCLEIINKYAGKRVLVIGYDIFNHFGIIDVNYRLIYLEDAKRLKLEDEDFNYVTIQELLERLERVNKGEYVVENGLIVMEKDAE